MLKKMRRRFIGAAMTAFLAVVLLLVCAVNLWNYKMVTGQQDFLLKKLLEIDSMEIPPPKSDEFLMPMFFDNSSGEMPYMIRFFVVRCNEQGEVQSINQDYIASVSTEDAKAFASHVFEKGGENGYYQGYRYLNYKTDTGSVLIFLNSERELQTIKTLLLITGIIAVCSLLAVFVLVVAFSHRAIAPYVRNIETQKQFITDAGHELRTPLTSISASADILAMEYTDDEWVQNIQSQSIRLSKLISNLVTLSRLDEEQPFPEKTDFSLSEAVWEISEPFGALAEAGGKEYVQHIEEGIIFHGDRKAIQQMISILMDNAVRYSNDGGKIRLDVRRRHKKVEITVYNTCILDGDIDMKRLFDRFYRPDKSRSVNLGGTGIGLSIARATVMAHGGTIKAESSKGNNITFTVLL